MSPRRTRWLLILSCLLLGGVAQSGLINVLWNGEVFSVFNEDLQEKAGPVSAAEV